MKSVGKLPDIVICSAGGAPQHCGFFAEIAPSTITSCLEINYYTSAFLAQSCLRIWLNSPTCTWTRHIVFTSSTAAFVGLPGYIAYTPPKVAIRALADTLRQELLLYGDDKYRVHCSFPGSFVSEALVEEQKLKPELLKSLEGTNMPEAELIQSVPTAAEIAKKIIKALEKGHTYITVDFQSELLLNNMRGPSPRHWSLYDFIIGLIAVVGWWLFRLDFDRKTRRYGHEKGYSRK